MNKYKSTWQSNQAVRLEKTKTKEHPEWTVLAEVDVK